MDNKTKYISLLFLVILILVTAYFANSSKSSLDAFKNSTKITFSTSQGETKTFNLKVATTMDEKAKGLMYVKDLPENEGMVFVYNSEGNHYFWMKNTFIPLDMIFLNSKKEIVGILTATKILSTETLSINQPSQYIIELNAGSAEKYNLAIGDKVNGEF